MYCLRYVYTLITKRLGLIVSKCLFENEGHLKIMHKVTYAVNVVVDGVVVTADYHPIATIQVTLGDFQSHSPIACLYDVFFYRATLC